MSNKVEISKFQKTIYFVIFFFSSAFLLTVLFRVIFLNNPHKIEFEVEGSSVIKYFSYNLPQIYDTNNTLLVTNVATYRIILDNTQLNPSQDEWLLQEVAKVLGKDDAWVAKFLPIIHDGGYRKNDTVILNTNDKNIINTVVSSSMIKYLKIESHEVRGYKFPMQLSNVIGYFKIDSTMGIEDYIYKNFQNSSIKSVNLTIDSNLQLNLFDKFSKEMSDRKLVSGVIALSNSENGHILASVSLPNFDPNDLTDPEKGGNIQKYLDDKNRPLLNKLTDVTFPPGSTMKVITGTAALSEGVISPYETIFSEGCMEISEGAPLCEFTKNSYGNLNIEKALGLSSNIYFCKLFKDKGMSINTLNDYQNRFGLGKSTGIEVYNEAVGVIPSPKYKQDTYSQNWYLGDSCNSAIGQGFTLVTPAQMLNVANTIAMNGKRPTLHYISHVLDTKGNYMRADENLTDLHIKSSVFVNIQNGMRQSAIANDVKGYEIYTKTGTAETGTGSPAHTWVIGYWVTDSGQKIAFAIFIENGGASSVNIGILKSVIENLQKDETTKKYAPRKI